MKMREQVRCETHNWVSYGETPEQASPCPTCSVIEAHAAGRREAWCALRKCCAFYVIQGPVECAHSSSAVADGRCQLDTCPLLKDVK
jgi:hypothetical protein